MEKRTGVYLKKSDASKLNTGVYIRLGTAILLTMPICSRLNPVSVSGWGGGPIEAAGTYRQRVFRNVRTRYTCNLKTYKVRSIIPSPRIRTWELCHEKFGLKKRTTGVFQKGPADSYQIHIPGKIHIIIRFFCIPVRILAQVLGRRTADIRRQTMF